MKKKCAWHQELKLNAAKTIHLIPLFSLWSFPLFHYFKITFGVACTGEGYKVPSPLRASAAISSVVHATIPASLDGIAPGRRPCPAHPSSRHPCCSLKLSSRDAVSSQAPAAPFIAQSHHHAFPDAAFYTSLSTFSLSFAGASSLCSCAFGALRASASRPLHGGLARAYARSSQLLRSFSA